MPLDIPIYFTRHARNRMRWHGISEADVKLCLANSEQAKTGRLGKINAWRKFGDRFLRVTYRRESKRLVIITAVMKRRLSGN